MNSSDKLWESFANLHAAQEKAVMAVLFVQYQSSRDFLGLR